MNALSAFAIKHRWRVVAGWVVTIIVLQVIAGVAGGAKYKDDAKLPGTETQKVSDLLTEAKLAQQNNASGTLVLHSRTGTLASEPADLLDRAKAAVCRDSTAHVESFVSPWRSVSCTASTDANSKGRTDLLSPDKTVGLVTVIFDRQTPAITAPQAVYKDLKGLRSPDLQVEFTGDSFQNVGLKQPVISPELLGFIAAFIILALVFRTFGSTVLPLLNAVAALGSGLALLSLLTHVMSVVSFAPNLTELMVIGVGIDYALFIVTRHRRNLIAGMSVEQSISNALNTSGRAVMFAGVTVCIAILGLCALGVSFLYGVAIGTAIGVALTMAASLTLLPAMLALLGRRALPRSKREELNSDRLVKVLLCVIPPVCFLFWILYGLQWLARPIRASVANRSKTERPTFWTGWANLIERRSRVFLVLSGALIVILAIPFFSLRLGHADQSNDPANATTRKGYELIESAFGKGYNSTLEVVVDGPGSQDTAYLNKVSTALASVPDVDKASVTRIPASKNVTFIAFKTISGPQDVATNGVVHTLRDSVLPPLYKGTTNKLYVYGITAVYIDFAKVVSSKMVFFILAVVGLSFLLLMVAFRSVVIPLTAASMNLLAAGASFGVVVAIFQWGWFGDILGTGKGGPIEAFLPVLFFAILFGLSMDYQVFLVSRMHEEWVHTGDNHRAVSAGQAETGGIITAAGLVMITVFGGFIIADGRVINLLGIGLASAIFLDAFIVRTMLVPAIMHQFGQANWWYPDVLDKITPRVSIEPPEQDDPAAPPDGSGEPELVRV